VRQKKVNLLESAVRGGGGKRENMATKPSVKKIKKGVRWDDLWVGGELREQEKASQSR